ncbi:ATPase family associated with various cellular activities (AAA) [Lachnospiraceae bacterium G11]|nr:ATPase family associated with various cellular activities (AAA) [Lachnospiraceae bacterium G11]
MNIREAKDYIKDTVQLYLTKDEFGDYRIPVVRQRPIFLLGAPGIGKTAVMSQIASELDIALVSYSMTHHTRQSALGLPFIEKKEYAGKNYSVSEYTMSEIIASVYDTMEESGVKEGILFLDEINCVSETLYPSMLQFLQYKVFGKHTVPEGWVIVTAGNPPEFNKAVREFDVVTLDRLKVIEVEADYPAWKKYAFDAGLHGSILNFLESNRDYFYGVETTAFGKNYVTARGWEDLSDIIKLYEESGKKVTESLVGQYIKNETVVKEYTAYYDLYNKYKRQYDVEGVFEGKVDEKMVKAVSKAAVDERLALTGLLSDVVKSEIKDIMRRQQVLKDVRPSLSRMTSGEEKDIAGYIKTLVKAREKIIADKQRAGSLTAAEKTEGKRIIALYKDLSKQAGTPDEVKTFFNGEIGALKERVATEQKRLDNLFAAMSKIFGEESNEMLVLVTELTLGKDTADFFASFGSDSYEKYNALLMVGDRKETLRKEILNIL